MTSTEDEIRATPSREGGAFTPEDIGPLTHTFVDDSDVYAAFFEGRLYLGDVDTAAVVVLPSGEVEIRDEARLSEAARGFWALVRGIREVCEPTPMPEPREKS